MSDDAKPRGGRPRIHPESNDDLAKRKRAAAKAHLKEVRAVTVAKTANLAPDTAARAAALQKRRGLRSFTALVTSLVDEATKKET